MLGSEMIWSGLMVYLSLRENQASATLPHELNERNPHQREIAVDIDSDLDSESKGDPRLVEGGEIVEFRSSLSSLSKDMLHSNARIRIDKGIGRRSFVEGCKLSLADLRHIRTGERRDVVRPTEFEREFWLRFRAWKSGGGADDVEAFVEEVAFGDDDRPMRNRFVLASRILDRFR